MEEERVQRKDFNEIEYEENVKRQQEAKESGTDEVAEDKSEKPEADEWEKCRGSHEPEEHWLLRKEFLKRNEGRFDKNRLLCLSQAFANMEFLGCKYPIETMEQVAELSAGIVEDYRSAKQGRLQRTFVKASDAAERKTKGMSGSRDKYKVYSTTNSKDDEHPVPAKLLDSFIPQVSEKNVALQSIMGLRQLQLQPPVADDVKKKIPVSKTNERGSQTEKYPVSDDVNVVLRKSFDAIKLFSDQSVTEILKKVDSSIVTVHDMKATAQMLKEFYLIQAVGEINESSMIAQSFSMCRKSDYLHFDIPPYNLDYGLNMKCELCIGPGKKKPFLTIHGEGKGQKESKRDACSKAVTLLGQLRPTIKIKECPNRIVERSEIFPKKKKSTQPPTQLPGPDSFAMKMMRKWGWKGGGLGKNEDGMLEPVPDPIVHFTRLGFGNFRDSSIELEANVMEVLKMERETLFSLSCDVQFSRDFSKGEREMIHKIALKLGFNSKSYGVDNNRHLVISRKLGSDQLFPRNNESWRRDAKELNSFVKTMTTSYIQKAE